MKLFDSHCHLQLRQFDEDRDAVFAGMQDREVGGIVVGTDYESSRAGLDLAKQHYFLWASIGLHPNDEGEFDVSKFEELAQDPKVVAIGECGLDYFRTSSEGQKEKFSAQIELAIKLQKPLIIHCRDNPKSSTVPSAHSDLQQTLQIYNERLKENGVSVVIHFFTGPVELAQKYLDLGCFLSFPGPITYTDMYDESIRVTPMDKIFTETDSPFAAPVPHRGKRNEPAYVEEVVKKIAMLKNISVEEMNAHIIINAQKVFGIV